jgi:hypothetical protein
MLFSPGRWIGTRVLDQGAVIEGRVVVALSWIEITGALCNASVLSPGANGLGRRAGVSLRVVGEAREADAQETGQPLDPGLA